MSLQAAAAALGAPEALVQRSAEARAKATGASVDDILTAWAGGAPAPAPEAPAESRPVEKEDVAPQETVATPEAASPAQVPTALPRQTVPSTPPVLTGRKENPFATMIGATAVFLLAIVIGLFAPGQPEPGTGVRTSNIAFTPAALDGRARYLAENCAACHTQQVRAIVADAGETEKVTLSDSNQVLGSIRLGPDLANVGARLDAAAIGTVLSGAGRHPSYASLDANDLSNLIAYLSESR